MHRSQSGCDMLMQMFISQPALMSAASRLINCFLFFCVCVRACACSFEVWNVRSITDGHSFVCRPRCRFFFLLYQEVNRPLRSPRRSILDRFPAKRQRSIASHFQEKHFRPTVPIRRPTSPAQFPLSGKTVRSFIVDFLSWIHRIHEGRDRVYWTTIPRWLSCAWWLLQSFFHCLSIECNCKMSS